MPLPGGLSTFTLTFGPYTDLEGNVSFAGMQGILSVSPAIVDSTTGAQIFKSISFVIGNDGTASVGPLVANDDPHINQGTQYSVAWQALSYKETPGNKTFVVPTASGATVDYDSLASATGTPAGPYVLPLVTSVNGHSGAVTLAASDVGLGNVDNTSDANKPVSTAQQTALNAKANIADIGTAGTATGDALRAAFVAHDSQVIDICAAPYNCNPGDDITTALQGAINTIAASGQSGTVRISKVGAYTMNGALQTGSYTGSAGTGAGQGGGQTHTWNAQVLFPALPFTNVKVPAITIEGAVIPTRGWKFTGDAQGVTITSNITSGKMFEAVSGYDGWGLIWTGVMPVFRNLILRLPDNPTAGAIDIQHALRGEIERVAVTTINAWVIPTAGNNSTNVGIALPQHYENGDVLVREVDVRGLPSAFRISEHAVFSNVQIVGCNVAFISNGGGHCNFFHGVDVEEVGTIFKLESGSTIALSVLGAIDSETNSTWPSMILADSSGSSASIIGRIDAREALGHIGTSNSSTVPLLDVTSANQGQGAGWKALNPSDNFARCGGNGLATTAVGAPGLCSPSMHPWLPVQGLFTVTAPGTPNAPGTMHQTSGGTNCQAVVPVLDGKTWGRPRRISGTFTLAASGNRSVSLLAGRNNDNSKCIYASVYNGNIYVGFGVWSSHAGYVATTAAAEATAGATITVDLEVHYANQRPAVVKVFINRVLKLSYALTATDLAALGLGTFYPYIWDGIAFGDADVTSVISSFVVRDIASTQILTSGTATLAAGTVAVADTRVTASSIIRLNRQAAGGTLGELSVALTAGTGFTINSSSNTDTSSVYYEAVSY